MITNIYPDKEIYMDYLHSLEKRFPQLSITELSEKVLTNINDSDHTSFYDLVILGALERLTSIEPDWTFVAAKAYLDRLYEQALEHRQIGQPYESFFELISSLTAQGIYHESLLTSYSKEEIQELGQLLSPEKDLLFNYIGLVTLSERYLASSHNGATMELPQERFMIIAMDLMKLEPSSKRIALVAESYWAMSNLYMTVATPTLANAGKNHGQLSSCFIDTVDDSLRSIYDTNTDIATLSKNGGGIGVYLGKIRSRGSSIKGFKNISSGVIPWMKQLNNTAVAVDQLGQRQGAIAVYLDVWHKDIFSFLDTRLNNGDERQRTHDLFTGVCLPDVFMEMVEKRENWYLFDPHEVSETMGFSLEDYFDEKPGSGEFSDRYWSCVQNTAISKEMVPAIELFKRIMISQLETGTPYMFYRDTVNRLNANHHEGMIYCANLCTEITQNMSPTILAEEYIQDGNIVSVKKPGDFVVCNLSSLSLAVTIRDDVLERLIPIQVRMLDNVIDVNKIPLPQAQLTNQKYRGIGLGTFGWHHFLALNGVKWESEEAITECDEIYENIAYLTIKASMNLAKEKGAYPAYVGSDWHTGTYFEKRGYRGEKWGELKEEVQSFGIRNGYLLAIAPNSSTALIAGSTASIDPIFRKEYSEEKKDYKIPVTAPDLTPETSWYYVNAYRVDQHWSIKQNEKRQKHIDQSISFNFYISNDIKAKDLLNLHLDAWRSGLKTTYYTRSTSGQTVDECESCHS
ncbi:ribonucleoside-diphosphate reductase subunit alpha [Bacillus sp. 2205SS5-2]|uniref:ribonucleoside-diphosphate reductase subunit alpha n=1 Tax=Bacillus sp. 2205SS5-2 TaxID=3109031 RepID=UPI0030063243